MCSENAMNNPVAVPKIRTVGNIRTLRSPNYNYQFNLQNGYFARWGEKLQDDPAFSPFGPEILDIEISAGGQCLGNCPYCSPPGTLVATPHGDVPIERLKPGDMVLGYDKKTQTIRVNEIEEKYERQYQGELICIELANGSTLKLTPDHVVILVDGSEKCASELTEKDEITSLS